MELIKVFRALAIRKIKRPMRSLNSTHFQHRYCVQQRRNVLRSVSSTLYYMGFTLSEKFLVERKASPDQISHHFSASKSVERRVLCSSKTLMYGLEIVKSSVGINLSKCIRQPHRVTFQLLDEITPH